MTFCGTSWCPCHVAARRGLWRWQRSDTHHPRIEGGGYPNAECVAPSNENRRRLAPEVQRRIVRMRTAVAVETVPLVRAGTSLCVRHVPPPTSATAPTAPSLARIASRYSSLTSDLLWDVRRYVGEDEDPLFGSACATDDGWVPMPSTWDAMVGAHCPRWRTAHNSVRRQDSTPRRSNPCRSWVISPGMRTRGLCGCRRRPRGASILSIARPLSSHCCRGGGCGDCCR